MQMWQSATENNNSFDMETCNQSYAPLGALYCPPVNDTLLCWPPTPANITVYLPCPPFLGLDGPEHIAHRTCLPDGSWDGNWTDYSACVKGAATHDEFLPLAIVLKDIYFVTSIISLTFLIITLVIFCYFRSLQCSRISIHKHLVASFIMRFVLTIIMFQPYVFNIGVSYREVDWLCKLLIGLSKYAQTANFAWMLVEGIYLHNRLAVCVFTSVAPFKLFCFIGWAVLMRVLFLDRNRRRNTLHENGALECLLASDMKVVLPAKKGLPLAITCVWCGLMQEFHRKKCWIKYAKTPLICIIFIPILVALVINSAFLVNIIRVLVMKLRSNNNLESRRIRKAIKATVVLLPLLGVANLLFLAQPASDGPVNWIYQVIIAVLPSCQGIFVSVLYCFMNSEVQNVIRKKWKRFRVNRAMYRKSGRQGSRTSSFYLSQSDTAAQSRRLNVFSNMNSVGMASAQVGPQRGGNGKMLPPFHQHYEEDVEEDGEEGEEQEVRVKLSPHREAEF